LQHQKPTRGDGEVVIFTAIQAGDDLAFPSTLTGDILAGLATDMDMVATTVRIEGAWGSVLDLGTATTGLVITEPIRSIAVDTAISLTGPEKV